MGFAHSFVYYIIFKKEIPLFFSVSKNHASKDRSSAAKNTDFPGFPLVLAADVWYN